MQLYIGNKNYSSWSLRPWLLMKHAGIPFEEKKVRLGWEDDSPFKKTMLALAPSGRVPLLIDDGFPIWDSLAIAETLAERFPDKQLWPRDPKQRARARSLCAEMHSGFGELRSTFGMNLEARLPEIGERMLREKPGVARDLKRIDAMWDEALEASGGPVPVRRLQHRRRLLRAGLHPRAHLRPAAVAAQHRVHAATCSRCRPSSSGSARRWPSTTGSPRTSRTGRAPDSGRARATEGEAGRGPLLLCHLDYSDEALSRRRCGSRRLARPAGRRSRLGARRRRRRRAGRGRLSGGGRGLSGVPPSRDARGARPRALRAQDRRPAIAASPSTPDPRSRSRRTCSAAT